MHYQNLLHNIIAKINDMYCTSINVMIPKHELSFLEEIDFALEYNNSIVMLIKTHVNHYVITNDLLKKDIVNILLDNDDTFVNLSNPILEEFADLLFRESARKIYKCYKDANK